MNMIEEIKMGKNCQDFANSLWMSLNGEAC